MKEYSRKKIVDEYTGLTVSRERKWQLRHPEQYHEMRQRLPMLVWQREDQRRRRQTVGRHLNSKSYRMEREVKNNGGN